MLEVVSQHKNTSCHKKGLFSALDPFCNLGGFGSLPTSAEDKPFFWAKEKNKNE